MKRIGAVIVTLIFFIVLAYNAYYAPLPDIKVSNTETVIIPGVEKEYTFLFLTDMHMAIKTKQDLGASLGDADERMKAFVNEEGILSSTQFTEWIAYANRLKPEGVLMCGDMIDYYSQENVEFLADNLQKLKVPYLYVLGNHEMYTLDWKMRDPRAYLNYFDVPSNGNATFDRRYYSYDYGDVHYVVLDTQLYESTHEDNHDTHHPDLYDVQVQWLRQDLATNTKKWTVVLMHRDPFQYAFDRPGASRAAGFDEEGVLFMPIFDEFHVDLVLSAHLHSYRNRGHVRNFDRDASGPLYILTGIAGDARRPKWKQHPLDVYVIPDREASNYMTMTVTPNQLVVKAFLADGTQIDESVIEK